MRLGRPGDAVTERERAISLEADPLYISDALGETARLGDWAAAARLSALAVPRGTSDFADRALVCLRCNDGAEYRRVCASILSTFAADAADRDAALQASWTISLAPNAVDDYARPLELADWVIDSLASLKAPANVVRDYRHEALRVRAAVRIRAGRTAEGLADLTKAAELADSDPVDLLLAAIAHARTGQLAEAKAQLARALAAVAAESGKLTSWQRKAELAVLRIEAEWAILDCVFPAEPFIGP